MILLRWNFDNTSSQRKRVSSAARNVRLSIPLLLCFAALLLPVGCQEQKPPPLPNKKTSARKKEDRQRQQQYTQEQQEKAFKEKVQSAVVRGAQWLAKQQAEDGGWHSQTYGNLKGGAATTALALYTVSRFSEQGFLQHGFPTADLDLSRKFLAAGLEKKGFVVCPDGSMDEPTYATALYRMAINPLQLFVHVDAKDQMEAFLRQEQCTDAKGFAKEDPNYGGWDLAGGSGLQGETPGTNISITRFVVQAINSRPGFSRSEKEVLLAWAARVQNLPGDGGFFFHPKTDHLGNKAEWTDGDQRKQARSYGTATCDGILLLAALDVPSDDPRMQAAVRWLQDHLAATQFKLDHVPGFEDAPPELDWQHGLRFYYLMTLAETLPHFPTDEQATLRNAIRVQLLSMQQTDGSWRNDSSRMREDDPLIATCFALIALSNLIAN